MNYKHYNFHKLSPFGFLKKRKEGEREEKEKKGKKVVTSCNIYCIKQQQLQGGTMATRVEIFLWIVAFCNPI